MRIKEYFLVGAIVLAGEAAAYYIGINVSKINFEYGRAAALDELRLRRVKTREELKENRTNEPKSKNSRDLAIKGECLDLAIGTLNNEDIENNLKNIRDLVSH